MKNMGSIISSNNKEVLQRRNENCGYNFSYNYWIGYNYGQQMP